MSKWFYISCHKFTCGVEVNDNDIITNTAPILKRFRGQPLENLKNWCLKNKIEIKEQSQGG